VFSYLPLELLERLLGDGLIDDLLHELSSVQGCVRVEIRAFCSGLVSSLVQSWIYRVGIQGVRRTACN